MAPMANYQHGTTSGATGGSTYDDARVIDEIIVSLESENHALRKQLLRSDAEVALLRQRLQCFEVRHDVLPVVTPTPTPTVDLSRLDTGLVTHIVSFLGTSLELRNLALTCKAFGWKQSATGQDLTLAEEVAQQVVCSWLNGMAGARITLSPYVRGTATWISILHESEHPLKFDTLLGRGIGHTNERRTSVHASGGVSTAVASNYVMESGIHYAEFQFQFQISGGRSFIGVARPMPNLDLVRYANGIFHFFVGSWYDDFLAARTGEWGSSNAHACHYSLKTGGMSWTDWDRDTEEVSWEGMERCRTGDTVGMLLNLDGGTLTVYKNDRRLGVMKDGLSGPYCWFVTVSRGKEVTIKKDEPPRA
ncbi:hypothetical protein THAOC_20729 [Thalassiosira oceanica]|uniref:B30.2/SPRY domain-containing protein n=1 Tax=Thalassiosira oceanica TaxID=159749 RepID=K0RZ61_THAOC|nr:hypothetical protein THAOC_20729 [Thalassiosira oceanica]|eukprot:EJK59093.1 hypothetical protein THAOC_20729 [Thalassiosira oceanica]